MMESLIWSIEHGAWWRPDRCGYTVRLHEAGRYSVDDAADIVRRANVVNINECLIPLEAVENAAGLEDIWPLYEGQQYTRRGKLSRQAGVISLGLVFGLALVLIVVIGFSLRRHVEASRFQVEMSGEARAATASCSIYVNDLSDSEQLQLSATNSSDIGWRNRKRFEWNLGRPSGCDLSSFREVKQMPVARVLRWQCLSEIDRGFNHSKDSPALAFVCQSEGAFKNRRESFRSVVSQVCGLSDGEKFQRIRNRDLSHDQFRPVRHTHGITRRIRGVCGRQQLTAHDGRLSGEDYVLATQQINLKSDYEGLKSAQSQTELRHVARQYSVFALFVCLALLLGGICCSVLGWQYADDERRLQGAALVGCGWLISGSGIALLWWL